MTNIGITPLINESNRVLAEAIKHFSLTVPAEKIVVTIQSKGRKNALGWFWSQSWKQKGKDSLHEINLSAEHLREHNMGETLIHELAHAENCHCKIQDCDKTGRRHNKHFKSMAERLGLKVEKAGSLGWAYTELAPVATQFLEKIKFDRALFEMCRISASKKSKQTTRLVKLECSCGYVARATRKWLDEKGALICPCNMKPMSFTISEDLGGDEDDND